MNRDKGCGEEQNLEWSLHLSVRLANHTRKKLLFVD